MRTLFLFFTLISALFAISLSYSVKFFFGGRNLANTRTAVYHLTATSWQIGDSNQYVVFGKHRNVAFVSHIYPPNQLYFYTLVNQTHGTINSDNVDLFHFTITPSSRLQMWRESKESGESKYIDVRAVPDVRAAWFMSDTAKYVAVEMTTKNKKSNIIVFDLDSRYGLFGISHAKWSDYNCSFVRL